VTQQHPLAVMATAALFSMGAGPTRAAADGERARIAVRFEEGWPTALREAVRADLEATMGPQRFELVDSESPLEVAASLWLSAPTADRPRCAIRLEDHLMSKRVERTVTLSRVPLDSWSVAIAAGADELLRASWAELALPGAPEPTIEPPEQVVQWVEQTVVEEIVEQHSERRARVPVATIGVRAAVDGFSTGLLQLGGDLSLQLWALPWFAIETAVGGRGMIPLRTARGTVQGWALSGEVGPAFSLLDPSSPIRLQAFVLLRASYASFDAMPAPDSIVTPVAGPALFARVGARGTFAVGEDHQLGAELAIGIPLLGFDVTDERGVLTGMSIFEIHGAIVWTVDVVR
jgi:hypothetical protein